MIVLDTHVWIWLISGDEKIQKAGYLNEINKAVKTHSIIIPAISLWELAMLVSKGLVILSGNTFDWINSACTAPGTSVQPLSPEIAYESNVLPGNFHGDPADRMIVATARVLSADLITFDKQIMEYSKKGFVKVLKN